jgi:EmrB/QacA subfamily drug resistance transporter
MWVTLIAMTLSSSMILVDQTAVPLATPDAIKGLGAGIDEGQWLLTANILPLAAFMVLGGRLGDLLGLRRVFLAGAAIFLAATMMAGAAQDMTWMISARVAQGLGAACMMPTAVAIVSAVAPADRRGMALGVLAGGSAFFAALGPVLGGILTSIDWRLVFFINVPLALLAIGLTLRGTPPLAPQLNGRVRDLDFAGMVTLAVAAGGVVFGLSQIADRSVGDPVVLIPLVAGAISGAAFILIELRVSDPLLDLRLFRHKNFLASNLSQVLAGSIELGMGYLLPFLLLLVIGVDPVLAGIALIPATIPIILAGPLAGRTFDRIGGRAPLTIGFLILAGSGIALAIAVPEKTIVSLVPGLVLQGLGLGIILTVNDPVGLNAVPENDRGRAAGMINTSEQLGGALGIAILLAVELGYYRHQLFGELAARGIHPTDQQYDQVQSFIQDSEQHGLGNVKESPLVQGVIHDLVATHVDGFRLTFLVAALIALVGAICSFALVRRTDRVTTAPVFGRRSRWIYANSGRSPGLTRHPPPPRD